jgi:hypothetical protein
MSGRVTVSPDQNRGAGYALIRIDGVPPGTSPRFGLRRADYAAGALGPDGWQVADAVLEPEAFATDGGALILTVGPPVCNVVEEGSVEFRLPAAGLTETVFWPAIRPQHAGLRRRIDPRPEAATTRVPTEPRSEQPPVQEPPPGPRPPPVTDKTPIQKTEPPVKEKGRGIPWYVPLLGVVALVLVVSTGYRAWKVMHPAQPIEPVVVTTVPVNPTSDNPVPAQNPDGPQADNLSRMSVPDIVAPNQPADMFEEANRRMSDGRRDDALNLMSEAADRHYPPALAALAKYYDPLQPRTPGIRPNARQAARYYKETVRSGDSSVEAAREALRNWLQRKAGNDPLSDEGLILKDFWP